MIRSKEKALGVKRRLKFCIPLGLIMKPDNAFRDFRNIPKINIENQTAKLIAGGRQGFMTRRGCDFLLTGRRFCRSLKCWNCRYKAYMCFRFKVLSSYLSICGFFLVHRLGIQKGSSRALFFSSRGGLIRFVLKNI